MKNRTSESGVSCYYAFFNGAFAQLCKTVEIISWIPAALSVGLAIFLMTIFNFEHPPAAGTALGFVVYEWSYSTIVFVLIFAVSLVVVKRLLKRYLKGLCT